MINWVFGDVDPVIGRRDIFDCFDVKFSRQEIYLNPNNVEIKRRKSNNYRRIKDRMEMYISKVQKHDPAKAKSLHKFAQLLRDNEQRVRKYQARFETSFKKLKLSIRTAKKAL